MTPAGIIQSLTIEILWLSDRITLFYQQLILSSVVFTVNNAYGYKSHA